MKRGLLLVILATALVFYGCSYRVQTKADLPFEAIAIGEIKNLTYEPRLQDRMHSALSETLMTYGFYIYRNARYRIDGEITAFNMRVLSELGLTATEYEIDISGIFKITDRETGKTYPIKILRPFSTHFTTMDRLSGVIARKENYTRNALSEMAQEIARYILYDLPEVQIGYSPQWK